MQRCATHQIISSTPHADVRQVRASGLPAAVEAAAIMEDGGHLLVLVSDDAATHLCPVHAAQL